MKRAIEDRTLNAIGLGCMNLSHAYGAPPSPEAGEALLRRAVDMGIAHFDTAALYGLGRNESLLGQALKGVRQRVFIASKAGMRYVGVSRVIDGRPETLKRTCDEALARLQSDYIDLYYLHRVDRGVPVEESVGALADLKRAGKIRGVGLSEVSAATLRRACAEHPVDAVQSEYSLWSRSPEGGVLSACRDLGVAFVAFSPLGRGFLAGAVRNGFGARDIRAHMPRFQEPNLSHNLRQYIAFEALARAHDMRPAQLALAWVLSRGEHVHAIPGTTNPAHLEENSLTSEGVPDKVLRAAEAIINGETIQGGRYPAGVEEEA